MERRAVPSTHLRSVGYDRLRKVMEVEFKNGRIYTFEDVPEDMHKGLTEASSAGSYFNSVIKPKFQGKEVSNG